MTPSTSVLTLSAALTPNHKHGHVQISLKCTLAECGNVSRLWVFNARNCGNSPPPCNDRRLHQGNTNTDAGGIKRQVA